MENLKRDLLFWSKRLYLRGLSPATSSNISVRFGNNILISRSGVCLNDMDEKDIVETDFDGNVLNSEYKASSEKYMHTLIYENREDINAVIHSHCPYITAFAAAGKVINKPILPDFVFYFDKVPIVPYSTPGSLELAQNVAKIFKKTSCALLASHGVVIGADNLQTCFYNLESLRCYAQTFFAAEMLGGAKSLTKKQIQDIKEMKK